jgi:hypothetical protein
MSQVEIADVIGVARVTLTKHFGHELARGRAACRRDLLTLMWTAARRGRVLVEFGSLFGCIVDLGGQRMKGSLPSRAAIWRGQPPSG